MTNSMAKSLAFMSQTAVQREEGFSLAAYGPRLLSVLPT
jgi:hypothetical protein